MSAMSEAAALIRAVPTEPCAPWPRHVLTPEVWQAMAAAPALGLRALWADTGHVHALLQDAADGTVLPCTVPVTGGAYPALSPHRPMAAWFERMIADLFGHRAVGGRDARPWLDHGHWAEHAPLSVRPVPVTESPAPPEFLPAEGSELHQVPLGPIHGLIAEAGHLRLTAQGEIVVRLEARLGYKHKGTLALMRGKSPRAAARFAARLSGDSAVAHAVAFARAAEAASSITAPPRATALRAVMAELERIANHLGDIAAIGEAAGAAVLSARALVQREAMLDAAAAAFGHRLMMDCVIPGGVAADITPDGAVAAGHALDALEAELPDLSRFGDESSALAARLAGVGIVSPALARACPVGGIIGRAAGRAADLRRAPGYPPYDALAFTVPMLTAGDAAARLRIRLMELPQSIGIIRTLLGSLPNGAVSEPLPPASGEGIGWAEGFRGDIWHWLRLDGGMIAACFPRDPSWLLWPLIEAAASGGAMDDLPLILASFNPSHAGMDL
jgi:Ni,Fe-hydrogenase III large subunit